ncbi:hypothetical protein [Ruegeria halocynthiae]|uniref:hypothetical protein n=1 Tax=Ruegeria halocynthiae TaxID=985054 RepID=UPI00068C5443|nr:hypothetical protein [Ruegeria halocynthiae]
MRLIPPLLLLITPLSACEKYTDATSPCFGSDGKPAVTRASSAALPFAASTTKDCSFEDIGAPK